MFVISRRPWRKFKQIGKCGRMPRRLRFVTSLFVRPATRNPAPSPIQTIDLSKMASFFRMPSRRQSDDGQKTAPPLPRLAPPHPEPAPRLRVPRHRYVRRPSRPRCLGHCLARQPETSRHHRSARRFLIPRSARWRVDDRYHHARLRSRPSGHHDSRRFASRLGVKNPFLRRHGGR